MRAAVARRGNMHQHRPLGSRAFFQILVQQPVHVLADRLGQTGGRNSNQRRMILRGHVVQPLPQVRPSAENRTSLAEARSRNIHRLAEMADDVAPHIGGAALRSMQKRQRSGDPAHHQRRPQRSTGLAWVARGNPVRSCRALRRTGRRAHFTTSSALPRLRGVSRHTGLITLLYTSRAKFTMPSNPASASLRSWL